MSGILQAHDSGMTILKSVLMILALMVTVPSAAETLKALPYPEQVDGLAVMQQVYFVNRHFAFDNLTIGTQSGPVRMITRQGDRLNAGNTLIRSLNNRPSNTSMQYQDKVYFPTGKVRGTAVLVISYADRPASYSIWLPELRKVRRVSEPAHDDRWGGSPLTYGDVYFRKPEHERHELLGSETFDECLGSLLIDDGQQDAIRHRPPEKSCQPRGRPIYRIKSTTTFPQWWYDYRIVTVDQETFADYRSDYFKEDKLVKRIEKDWRPIAGHDRRALMWRYWYAEDYVLDQQAIGYVRAEDVLWNQDVDSRDWTERALRKIKR